MKKMISSLLLIFLLVGICLPSLCACKQTAGSGSTVTLYVYNWGEYMSDGSEGTLDSNALFEEWYYKTYGQRVKVNYSTYSSNESMYAKVSSGSVSYDIVIPSDYMIERMIAEDLLAPLDYSNIPNASATVESFRDPYYDPDCDGDGYSDYSVPYMYGMIGIIYNATMVDAEDIGSWSLMWNEKYSGNILQFNNSRDAFGSAQYYMGDVDLVNSQSESDWRQALEKLKEQKPILQGYVMDEIYNKMENGSAAISAYYAGDFLTMYENNDDLDFYYPSEGTNLYVDAMCVLKSSKNKTVAERYINFMLTEEPAVANAEYTYYASPNSLVRQNQDYIDYMNSIKDNGYELMYDTDSVKTSSYRNLSAEKLLMLNNMWEELKSDISVSIGIYVICAVIVAAMIFAGIFFAVRRKKRDIY